MNISKDKRKNSFESEIIEVSETEVPYITMADEEIVKQAKLAEEEIKQGKTISQDQLFKDAQNWYNVYRHPLIN